MGVRTVLLWALCLVLMGGVLAEPEKSDGQTSKSHEKNIADIEKRLDALLEMEAELENEIADDQAEFEEEERDEEEDQIQNDQQAQDDTFYNPGVMEDPCGSVKCSAGRQCVVTNAGTGACRCVEACEDETDPRRRVCSNHNETWMTDCDLHRQRCLCTDGLSECQDEKYEHLHIDYYGQCQELPECVKEEFEDFPRRMREWLFNVMRDMADREILSKHYQKLEKEAEEDETHQWSNAVVWKWCDLDGHPKDKVVSRHELFPLRAPLYTLEHCIAPFLDSCDPDDDHKITLREWGMCLQLGQSDLDNMDELCEDIRENEEPTN